MALTLIITDAGRAAIVNAQNTGTAPVTITQAGLSEAVIAPDAAATALAGEVKRLATVAGTLVADDIIHVTVTDESSDAYSLRAFALYLADGTLFAIYGQAEPVLIKTAATNMLLQQDIKLVDVAAAAITFGDLEFVNPPASETVKGVLRLSTQAQADAGADDETAVTPRKMKTSVFAWVASLFADVWRASNDGSGSGLDADLLDGQEGSWYANVPARLGYTPANKAGETFTGQVSSPSFSLGMPNAGIANSSGLPIFEVDVGDYYYFNRPANIHQWIIGGVASLALRPDGYAQMMGGYLVGSNVVWHAGNDGAGSGLDADLLDGQDGSWYANVPARLGYTPLNAASYTAADIKAKLLTVDGSGSGVDADLLDGQHGSFYADIAARLGYTPLNAASYTATDIKAKLLTVDGSGSGVDADLLDGQHASAFLQAESQGVVRAAGELAPASGSILRGFNVASVSWFSARVVVSYSTAITNPVPVMTGGDAGNGSSAHSAFWGSGSYSNSNGFGVNFGVSGGGGSITKLTFVTSGV